MNIINGTSGDDTLVGTSGDDYVDGGAGADTMSGLAGNDVYIVNDTGDVVIENPGEGTDRINSTVSYTLPANVENLWLVGTLDTSGVGNGLGNTLWGNSGVNVLSGLGGDDYLDGGAGADTMIGGTGDDTYWVDNTGDVVTENAGEGNDTVYLTLSSYTLASNVENLVLKAGAGDINCTGNELNNAITGNEGSNIIVGGAGTDTIDGGTGADAMSGGTGDDTFYVDNAGDIVTENPGEGTDLVISTLASYTLAANAENLTLGRFYGSTENLNGTGNNLDNEIRGNTGDNVLDGAGGSDTLVGGDGNDTLTGGAGNDMFYISTTDAGTDTITDLSIGDVVRVCNVMFSGSITDGDGSTAANGDIQVSNTNGQTILHIGTDDNAGADLAIALDGDYAAQYFHTQGFDLWYDTNHAPEAIVSPPDQDAFTSNTWSFRMPANIFTDADNDTLTYSAVAFDMDLGYIDLPSWLQFDPDTQSFTGTPTNGDVGSFIVIVSATDPSGASASSVFTLNVNQSTDGTSSADVLNGTSGNDALNGFAGNDSLSGGAGNDILNGGIGADVMLGGAGNDTYVVDNGSDKVFETTAQTSSIDAGGIDTIQSSINWTLGNFVENLTLTGHANINATGNALANTILGNDGNNILDGKAGADTMAGGAGNDTYVVDNAGDAVVEQASAGIDLIRVVTATAGGTFTLADNVENGILANSVAYNLTGNALYNNLTGNGAANKLLALAGDDSLDGKLGNDVLWGGSGADHFVFSTTLSASNNVDKIMDFNEGEGDVIGLAAGIFTALGGSVTADEIRSGAGATKALTASQHLIYNSTTGNLYYDKDGAGGAGAVLFATIDLVGVTTSHPAAMSAADFYIS